VSLENAPKPVAGLIELNPLEPNPELGLPWLFALGDKAALPNIDPEPNVGLCVESEWDGPPKDMLPKDGPSSDAMASSAGGGGAGGGEAVGCVGDGDVPNPNATGPADEKAPNPPDKVLDPKVGEDDVCPNGEVDEV
jgi:hypothetical protein